MEGTKLHPVREARGWVLDPVKVAGLKATRMAPSPAAPARSDGQIAAKVFYLFDHGRELREIVQEAEVPPHVVRELRHEWLTDLHEGETERRKTAREERRRRREEEELRELERRKRAGAEELRDHHGRYGGSGAERRQGLGPARDAPSARHSPIVGVGRIQVWAYRFPNPCSTSYWLAGTQQ
jgi:hypothetical protein